MNVIDTCALPCQEYGENIKRQIRLIASPQTTGENRVNLVHVHIPPHGVSEGHIHEDCDEYILFLQKGKTILDNETFDVPGMGVVLAKSGMRHTCVNTSDQEGLDLFCIFTKPFTPYGCYPELIKKTNCYFKTIQEKEQERSISSELNIP